MSSISYFLCLLMVLAIGLDQGLLTPLMEAQNPGYSSATFAIRRGFKGIHASRQTE